jgi:hypothetical protein
MAETSGKNTGHSFGMRPNDNGMLKFSNGGDSLREIVKANGGHFVVSGLSSSTNNFGATDAK